jgi:ABC-type Na+ transport system ATPase subunit NatA
VNDAAAAVIELRDASKSYGAVQALRDGNLALRPGEVRALMGENGAGKSTRRIDRGQMHSRVQGLLDRLGVRLDPERPVTGLQRLEEVFHLA